MNEDARRRFEEQLNELDAQIGQRLGQDRERHDAASAHVEQVRSQLRRTPADHKGAHVEASSLERRLLAWEAEHPQLASLAGRLVRALEDAGL